MQGLPHSSHTRQSAGFQSLASETQYRFPPCFDADVSCPGSTALGAGSGYQSLKSRGMVLSGLLLPQDQQRSQVSRSILLYLDNLNPIHPSDERGYVAASFSQSFMSGMNPLVKSLTWCRSPYASGL